VKIQINTSRILPLAIAAALAVQASAETPAKTAAPSPAQQADAYFRKGQAAEKAGDAATAKQAYYDALRLNPKHANARYSLGQVKINYNSIAAKGREAKFGGVIVPEYKLDEASLQEALDALSLIVEKETKEEIAPNFIIQDPKNAIPDSKITLALKNTPARGILKYVLDQVGAKARYDEHAIVILPK
jgi:tetratricopeptide (TPR) repeat protein